MCECDDPKPNRGFDKDGLICLTCGKPIKCELCDIVATNDNEGRLVCSVHDEVTAFVLADDWY